MKQNSYELKQHILQVWKLSLPAILTQITTIVMQYIDSAMVGALGANASASIGLVSTTTWLFGGVTYAVSAGFSVQVAHHIGAGEEHHVEALKPLVAGDGVGGHGAVAVADVQLVRGVVDRRGDIKRLFFHGILSFSAVPNGRTA